MSNGAGRALDAGNNRLANALIDSLTEGVANRLFPHLMLYQRSRHCMYSASVGALTVFPITLALACLCFDRGLCSTCFFPLLIPLNVPQPSASGG